MNHKMKWELLQQIVHNHVENSKRAKQAGTLTVYGEGNLDGFRAVEREMDKFNTIPEIPLLLNDSEHEYGLLVAARIKPKN